MYVDQIISPAQVAQPPRLRVQRPVWLRPPSLAALVAVVIVATALALALTLSGSSAIHSAFHKAPAAAGPAPAFTPPLVPAGYVRISTTHQLIRIR